MTIGSLAILVRVDGTPTSEIIPVTSDYTWLTLDALHSIEEFNFFFFLQLAHPFLHVAGHGLEKVKVMFK